MQEFDPIKPYFAPTAVEYTSEGMAVTGLLSARTELSPAEAVEAIEKVREAVGADEARIVGSVAVNSRESRAGGRAVFGFSNWNGCKWEPTGPKGRRAEHPPADPTLN